MISIEEDGTVYLSRCDFIYRTGRLNQEESKEISDGAIPIGQIPSVNHKDQKDAKTIIGWIKENLPVVPVTQRLQQIPPEIKIYEFRWGSGEKEWVSGRTMVEAIQTYCQTTGSDVTEWEGNDDIVELPRKDWVKHTVHNLDHDPKDPQSWKKMSFPRWLVAHPQPVSQIIAGTPYL